MKTKQLKKLEIGDEVLIKKTGEPAIIHGTGFHKNELLLIELVGEKSGFQVVNQLEII